MHYREYSLVKVEKLSNLLPFFPYHLNTWVPFYSATGNTVVCLVPTVLLLSFKGAHF